MTETNLPNCVKDFSSVYGGPESKCKPEKFFEPKSITEIRQILSVARILHKKVSVFETGYVCSRSIDPSNYIISMRKLSGILKVDDEQFTITAMTGTVLDDLCISLDTHGLSLPVLPFAKDVTVGEAITFGYHGTGSKVKSLSAYVLELELLTSSGDLLTLTSANDPDLFRAACLNLGALGVIVMVKLQCKPKFYVKAVKHGSEFQQLLEYLPVHIDSSDYFSFTWHTHTEGIVVSHIKQCPATTIAKQKMTWMSDLWRRVTEPLLFRILLWLSYIMPSLRLRATRLYYKLASRRSVTVGPSNGQTISGARMHGPSLEWAVLRSKATLVLYELRQWFLSHQNPVNALEIQVTFCAADDVLLSSAHHRDACFIRIPQQGLYGQLKDLNDLVNVMTSISTKYGGKIHLSSIPAGFHGTVKNQYPEMERFLEIRQRLDPDGMFLNSTLCEMFGIT